MSVDELPYKWTRRQWMVLAGLIASGTASAHAQDSPKEGSTSATPGGGVAKSAAPINVAVVLGAYNTLIDFAGPWEVLSSGGRFNVYSVAASRSPVLCDDARSLDTRRPISGLTVIPDFTFDDAPQPQIIVVGGQDEGTAVQAQARKIDWIRRASEKADLTASVCVGAFELGRAGLLDGQSATTNRNAYEKFQTEFPKVKLVRGVRFVESGRVATATGLTAGFDLALRITDRFCGRAFAKKIADYEEWTSNAWATGG